MPENCLTISKDLQNAIKYIENHPDEAGVSQDVLSLIYLSTKELTQIPCYANLCKSYSNSRVNFKDQYGEMQILFNFNSNYEIENFCLLLDTLGIEKGSEDHNYSLRLYSTKTAPDNHRQEKLLIDYDATSNAYHSLEKSKVDKYNIIYNNKYAVITGYSKTTHDGFFNFASTEELDKFLNAGLHSAEENEQ